MLPVYLNRQQSNNSLPTTRVTQQHKVGSMGLLYVTSSYDLAHANRVFFSLFHLAVTFSTFFCIDVHTSDKHIWHNSKNKICLTVFSSQCFISLHWSIHVHRYEYWGNPLVSEWNGWIYKVHSALGNKLAGFVCVILELKYWECIVAIRKNILSHYHC